MIANSGHDENGKYKGGKAGDQTKTEFAVIPWYNRPWSVVLRYPDQRVAKDIAYLAKAAAENDHIGYDQNQRSTFWKALSHATGYDTAKVTEDCESDCTCGVATIVKAAGLRKGVKLLGDIDPDYYYSGNLKPGFRNLGFQILTDSKYLTSDRYLLPGDILLYENHHAATNLDVGSLVRDEWVMDRYEYRVGWNRDDTGWWYADSKTTYYKSCWKVINNCWYYFDKNGYAVKGLQDIGGAWYFFVPWEGHDKECALMRTNSEGELKIWFV